MYFYFTILILGTFIGAALLTPWVATALYFIFGQDAWPFSRIYDRVAMVVALALVITFFKQFSLGEVWAKLKSIPIKVWCTHGAFGLALALLNSALILFMLSFGEAQISLSLLTPEKLVSKLPKIILSAVVISLIEEVFFRGVLLLALRRHLGIFFAVVLSTLLYASVHFIAPIKKYQYLDHQPLAGIEYLLKVIQAPLVGDFLPAFFGLCLVGIVLATIMIRTGSLVMCIGLHCGWIIAIKLSNIVVVAAPGVDLTNSLIRRFFLVSEPISWSVLILVLFLGLVGIKRIPILNTPLNWKL